jgi:hypothetical protein
MIFSTSSPTYPASVNVVASATVNGTSSSLASVSASKRLTRARWPHKQNIGLTQFNIFVCVAAVWRIPKPFVMVINRNGEHALGPLLANHVLVKNLVDFVGNRQLGVFALTRRLLNFLANNVVAEIDTLVANKDRGPAISFLTSFWLLPQNEQ